MSLCFANAMLAATFGEKKNEINSSNEKNYWIPKIMYITHVEIEHNVFFCLLFLLIQNREKKLGEKNANINLSFSVLTDIIFYSIQYHCHTRSLNEQKNLFRFCNAATNFT